MKNQQNLLNVPSFNKKIASVEDAAAAITVIKDQGEGAVSSPPPMPPFKPEQFTVPEGDRLSGSARGDLSHFGRLLLIQQSGLPEVYSATETPSSPTVPSFQKLIDALNKTWATGRPSFFTPMYSTLSEAVASWKDGKIPRWS